MAFRSAKGFRLTLMLLLAWASAAAPAASAQSPAPQAEEQTLIQVGDVVVVTVYGDAELRVEAPVLPDGTIAYPFAGSIRVAGKSPSEVAEELAQILAEYVRHPVVTVAVRPGKGPSVAVLGEVRNPGLYPLTSGSASLLEVIAAAGGPLLTADLAGVRVYDGGSISDFREAPIGSNRVLFEGEASENPEVFAGNVVYVPRGMVEVSVMGPVARPGRFEMKAGSTLLDLISLAGGLAPEADPSSLVLRRQVRSGSAERIVIDLQSVLLGNVPDPVLQDGDLLYVQSTIQVAVAGEVRNNGVFRLGSDSRLTDAILAAGGLTPDADRRRVTVSRTSGGVQERIEVDFDGVLSGAAENIPLRDGDIVNVPRGANLVHVAGAVRNPGAYRALPGVRLIDAVYAAGGPTPDAEVDEVFVFAAPGFERIQDLPEEARKEALAALGEVLFTGPIELNPPLEPGQTVYVPKKYIEIFVLGAVRTPGLIEVPRGSTILDVAAAVGGPNVNGDWRSVQLLRRDASTAEVIDVLALLDRPEAASAYVLDEWDAVYVPENAVRVSVLGDVQRPGTYTLSRSSRVVDALAAAGGASRTAALESVSVIKNTETLEPLQVRLGQHDRLVPGDVVGNLEVEDGTVVIVPKSRRVDWQQLVTVLTGVKLILDLVDWFR